MKIKHDYERIIDEIALIEPKIMIIITDTLFPNDNVEDFDTTNISKTANSIAYSIMFRTKGINYRKFLRTVIKKNNEVVGKEITYHKSYEEIVELVKRRAKQVGKREDNFYYLILFKFFSEHMFQGEIIDKLKEKSTEMIKIALNYTKKINKETRRENILLSQDLMGSKTEAFFNNLVFEYESSRSHYKLFDANAIEQRFMCEYNKRKKEFNNVKRGILFFLFSQIDHLEEFNKYSHDMSDYLQRQADELREEKEVTLSARKHFPAMIQQINRLKEANKKLKKENERLDKRVIKKIEKGNNIELEKQLHNLQKENNYNLSRIEKLEEQTAILEEEKKLNENLQENIQVEEKPEKTKSKLPEYQNIVVMGGRWTSNNRKVVIEYLATNEVEFIEADKTLRHFDRIANADIIFYDTTYNGHDYYYKAKKLGSVFYHINNSNLLEFEKIFEGKGLTNRNNSEI